MTSRRVRFRMLGVVSIALWSYGPLSTAVGADVTRFVSDMNWASAVNGWGPAERDRSNGELGATDGGTLTIAGVTYVKGLGVHAHSDIRLQLGGACTTFNAVIGLDDETGANGSVVFLLYGDGTPLYSSGVLTGSSPGVPVSVAVNGFNELALIVTDAGNGPFYDHADWANASVTCAGAPQSQFAPPVSLPALVNPHDVKMADLNGDGRLDLVAAMAGTSAVSVWLGNGNATFGTRMDFATGLTPKSVALRDLNGDGRLDLVTPNQSAASVSVLLARATGGFGYLAAVDYPACFGTHDVDAGDFTSDGIADLIVACWGGNVVSFLRGIGNGTFAPLVNYTVGAVPVSVVARDFNADGRLDAAVATYNDSTVSVLIGRGDGTFNPFVPYQVGSGPHMVRAGDVNGDGRLDLAVANDLSNTISVLRGLPNGTFAGAVHFPTGAGPEGVAIGDINGDGLADLLSANSAGNYPVCCNPGGDTISLLLNTGGGFFAAPQTHTVGTTPFALSAGDLDGDGDLDVATANWHSNDLTVLRNGGGSGGTYLSDLPWTSMINGWGPAERDRSNGELGANDGGTISLDGVTYAKGLGVHADSQLRWPLNGQCSTFSAVIGVDDEVGPNGSVYFQVYVDGQIRYMSPLMTGSTSARAVQVDISGGTELTLVVHYGWDSYHSDHADWADARLVCTS
jgi:NPCBM/NEW2 domain/FG-GAP-like repeat